MKRSLLYCTLVSATLLIAFTVQLSENPSLPPTSYNYESLGLPPYFSIPAVLGTDNTPFDNAVTDAGATLGRVLFYDTRMSVDGTISCSSCHLQAHGFSDPDSVSTGVFGRTGTRNSMSLAGIRYYRPAKFAWDEFGRPLEEQMLIPLELNHEMGNSSVEEVITRLEATDYYTDLFTDAFGSPDITSERMGKAMAQFVRSIVSYRTRYDYGRVLVPLRENPFPNFSDEENVGKDLYFGEARCSTCHRGDLTSLVRAFNTGLDSTTIDPGRGGHSGQEEDMGVFKSPSLRNIAHTAPYMHDARFATLDEVIEFYDSGVQPHPNLGNPLKSGDGTPLRLNLSFSEKESLVAFLHTLTDEPLLTDVRWSDPFVPLIFVVKPLNTTIPSTGGTATADIELTNTGSEQLTVNYNVKVTLPDGSLRPIIQTTNVLEPGESVTRRWNNAIPANQPEGTYTVDIQTEETAEIASVGSVFTFKKHPPSEVTLLESSTAVAAVSVSEVPTSFGIHPAFPNPFNSATTVRFDIPEAADVTVEVMEMLGRRIAVLADGPLEAGTHEVRWEPTGLPAGLYVVRVRTGDNRQIQTQRITFVR